MKYGVVRTLLTLLFASCPCNGAKILGIFPTASFSHQQPLLAVSRALAAKGHDLTVITTNPSKTPIKNHREIDLSFLYQEYENLQKVTGYTPQEQMSAFKMASDWRGFGEFFSNKALASPQIKQLIQDFNGTKFDLIIYESLVYSGFLGFGELVGNPPVVGLLTIHPVALNDVPIGNPLISSYIPSSLLPHDNRMSFKERMTNLLFQLYLSYIRIWNMEPMQEVVLKTHFGDVKHSAYELERNISMVIISADLATAYSKPVHSNTVYVGPIHIGKEEPLPLPQDLQKWLDDAEDGVVYFSMGSTVRGTAIPEEKRAAFIKAFSQFPRMRVLWKWEEDTRLPGQPPNVLTMKWLPQQSLLAHPKLKLFISQVGLQSFQEAVYYGVPILGIPIFGDQPFLAKKVLQSGTGRVVQFADITYEAVYENLKELLTNDSYKENMRHLSQIIKDKPMSALDTAIWWIEYVLRHNGAPHLRPSAIDLAWYEYYCFDVIAILVIPVSVLLYAAIQNVKKGSNKLKTN